MPQYGRTTCDVKGCSAEYEIEYNVSIPPSHPSEFWYRVNGYSICPVHAQKLRNAMMELFPERAFK